MATVVVPIKAKDETKAGINKVEGRLKGLAGSAAGILGGLGIAGGIAAGVGALRAGVDAAADFETALTNISARTELTEEGLESVRQTALDMGRDTKFSASNAAQGMLELITSGSSAAEAVATIPNVLSLAAAAGLDLGHAADGVTDIMAQFGLSVDDAETVVNALTAASGSSSATVADLIDSMKNGGAIANGFGLDVGQTAAAMAVLAENGLKGAEAGTALKSFFLNATRETSDSQIALTKLGTAVYAAANGYDDLDEAASDYYSANKDAGKPGSGIPGLELSFYDAEGAARDFNDVIGEISEGLAFFSDEEANALLKDLAGSYGQVAARALVASGGIDEMEESMDGQRTAGEVAEEQMDTLQARMDSFGSTMETLAIKVLTPLIDNVLKPFVEFITASVNAFNEWLDTDQARDAIEQAGVIFERVKNTIELWAKVLQNVIRFVQAVFAGDWGEAFDAARAVVQSAVDYIGDLWSYMLEFITFLIKNFGPIAVRALLGFVNGVISLLETAFRGILGFVENILNSIIRLINDTLNSLPDFVKDTVFNVTGGKIDIKKGVGLLQETSLASSFSLPRVALPAFANSGAAPTLPTFSAPASGPMTQTVYVTVQPSTVIGDPQSLAAEVNELMRRGFVR